MILQSSLLRHKDIAFRSLYPKHLDRVYQNHLVPYQNNAPDDANMELMVVGR